MKKKNGFATNEILTIFVMSTIIIAIVGLLIAANMRGEKKEKEADSSTGEPTEQKSIEPTTTVEISKLYEAIAYNYIAAVNNGVFTKIYNENVSFTGGTFDGKTYTGKDGETETIDVSFEGPYPSDVSLHVTDKKVDGGTFKLDEYTINVNSDGTITLSQVETNKRVERSAVALTIAESYVKSVNYTFLSMLYENPSINSLDGTFDGKTFTSEDGTTMDLQVESLVRTPSSISLVVKNGVVTSGVMIIDDYSITTNLGIFRLN